MPRPQLQHYVPQFYLRQWCDGAGTFWAYPIAGGAPHKSSPRAFAAERGIYNGPAGSIYAGNTNEAGLSKIEGLFASQWPGIFERLSSQRTKLNLARFISLLYLRSPDTRDTIREINGVIGSMLAGYSDDQVVTIEHPEGTVRETAGKLRRLATPSEPELQDDFLRSIHNQVEDLAKVLASRKWGILRSDDPVFLTSDRPIALWRGCSTRPRFGFRTKGTQITFPISPRHLLMVRDEFEEDGLIYPLLDTLNLNDGVVLTAERFVFGFREDPRLVPHIWKQRNGEGASGGNELSADFIA